MKTNLLSWFTAFSVLVWSSCSQMPSEPEPEPTPPPPSEITVADLKINKLEISPEFNDHIYSPVKFAADEKGVWRGKVEHYTTNLTSLKASFDVMAAKVTIGNVEQQTGVTVNDFTKSVVYRLYATDGQYREFTVSMENGTGTGMPLVAVFTDGGAAIDSKDDWRAGRIVLDPQASDYERLDAVMEIKGRGNNTWTLPKKPYAIKLGEKSPVMGMNKHKRWVLLANANDRTLMRNRVAFEIARRTELAWTPDSRFVEVFVNGVYQGNYLLCEQIKIDKNRVNIDEMTAADTQGEAVAGGYLLEYDRYWDEINKFRTSFRDLPVNIKEPDEEVLGEAQRKYISDYVSHVEELLYTGETIDPDYKNYIDVDSFIDWWIVMELTTNRDSRLPGSCYMYKARSGKLFAGPVWDFDLTTFKSEQSFMLADYEVTDFSKDNNRSLWYKKLVSDPEFKARAKERWASYQSVFEDVDAFIEQEADGLKASAAVNWAMWKTEGQVNHDESLSWEEAVAKLRENYTKRFARLNVLINTL